MDWAFKAALTAAAVSVVMMAARLFGRQLAGLLAGLPLVSAPALLGLAQTQDLSFAHAAALGSLAACAATPLFAIAYLRMLRRHGPALALACGLFAFVAALLLLWPLKGQPLALLLLAAACTAGVCHAVDREHAQASWVRPRRGEPWFSAVTAGLVAAALTQGAQSLGPFWMGAVAAVPIIGACALVHLSIAGGRGDVALFVGGYARGCQVMAVVLFAFWLLAGWVGAVAALAIGIALGALLGGVWTQRLMAPR